MGRTMKVLISTRVTSHRSHVSQNVSERMPTFCMACRRRVSRSCTTCPTWITKPNIAAAKKNGGPMAATVDRVRNAYIASGRW